MNIEYDTETNEKQVEMCVDLAIEVVGWVGDDGLRASVATHDGPQPRVFEGTLGHRDNAVEYRWVCEVVLADSSKLQATLTQLEEVGVPPHGG